MFKEAFIAICLMGCSDFGQTVTRPDLAGESLLCGWTNKGTKTLGQNDKGCWQIILPSYVAVLPPGAEPCEVHSINNVIWYPGETMELWSKTTTSGDLPVVSLPVECPIQ